jgi:pimeloyl-ACP methyl ester carboxylesterase
MIVETKIGKIAFDHIDCGKSAPLLIITHGRGRTGNRNTSSKTIGEYLKNFGISSLRFDLYGYGESDGDFQDITITTAKDSALEMINYAKDNLKFTELFLFGTSYGGSGMLAALQEIDPNIVTGAIFRSTVLNYLAKTYREFSKEELVNWKRKGFINDSEGILKYSFVEDMAQYANVDYEKLKKFKILYFHGAKDPKVLMSELEEMESNLSDFELIVYPNSGHAIDREKDFEDMLVKTKDFLLN